MDVFFETLKIMGAGMTGIFIAMLIIYFMIQGMLKISEQKN